MQPTRQPQPQPPDQPPHIPPPNEQQQLLPPPLEQSEDPRLDLSSCQFDAALALASQRVRLPVPDAPLLDNVSKCAAMLVLPPPPRGDAAVTGAAGSQAADPAATAEQQKQAAAAAQVGGLGAARAPPLCLPVAHTHRCPHTRLSVPNPTINRPRRQRQQP